MTSLPRNAADREALPPSYVGGYADVVQAYIDRGWTPPLPLPRGQKWPPPTGFTGRSAQTPTPEQVEAWRSDNGNGNPALYLAEYEDFALLAVDIDNYAKGDRPAGRALEVIAEVEGRAGCTYPPTYVLRNRTDGSEKRIYRVPTGLTWRSNLGAGVDLIHHGHRYVNAGVNPDTGNPELWYEPNGGLLQEPPKPRDFAELSTALVLEHIRDTNGMALPGLASAEDADRLLMALPDGDMSAGVRELMVRAMSDLSGLRGSRHDQTLKHVSDIVKLGAAGLAGSKAALDHLKLDFVEAVWNTADRNYSREVASDEFDSMVLTGGRRAGGLGPGGLAAQRAMAPGGLWHPDTLVQKLAEVDVDADGDEAFWAARDVLGDLRQFARSRRVGPWAMLGQVLARALTVVPPNVVLPPIIGGAGSLNLFVALVGESGDGKGASARAAADWLTTAPIAYTATLGSGEGMGKVFAYKRKDKTSGGWEQVGLRHAVLFDAPEVDNLAALGGRSGATLMPQLRSAYSGETLGFTYADPSKALQLCAHRYRLCLTVGVQPRRAAALFNDQDGGTPQRFVWLPVLDPEMPDVRPDEPPRLELPDWDELTRAPGGNFKIKGDASRAAMLGVEVSSGGLTELAIPDVAVAAIDGHHVARHRGENVNPLDGHKLQTQVNVAAALMWLDCRTDAVTEEDWELAEIVMSVSDRTRERIQASLRAKAGEINKARGRADAEREDVKSDALHERKIARLTEGIRDKLRAENNQKLNVLKKRFRGPDREFIDEALERLVAVGDVELEPIDYQGNPGYVVRLKGLR